uniref:Uncharacterized protein n=1 Tax=Cacopsylla melanoneura TaxID=428564 RepID=A0A8D9DWR9_9HEMI
MSLLCLSSLLLVELFAVSVVGLVFSFLSFDFLFGVLGDFLGLVKDLSSALSVLLVAGLAVSLSLLVSGCEVCSDLFVSSSLDSRFVSSLAPVFLLCISSLYAIVFSSILFSNCFVSSCSLASSLKTSLLEELVSDLSVLSSEALVIFLSELISD